MGATPSSTDPRRSRGSPTGYPGMCVCFGRTRTQVETERFFLQASSSDSDSDDYGSQKLETGADAWSPRLSQRGSRRDSLRADLPVARQPTSKTPRNSSTGGQKDAVQRSGRLYSNDWASSPSTVQTARLQQAGLYERNGQAAASNRHLVTSSEFSPSSRTLGGARQGRVRRRASSASTESASESTRQPAKSRPEANGSAAKKSAQTFLPDPSSSEPGSESENEKASYDVVLSRFLKRQRRHIEVTAEYLSDVSTSTQVVRLQLIKHGRMLAWHPVDLASGRAYAQPIGRIRMKSIARLCAHHRNHLIAELTVRSSAMPLSHGATLWFKFKNATEREQWEKAMNAVLRNKKH